MWFRVLLCHPEDWLEMFPHNHEELDGFESIKDKMNVCIKEK